MHDWAVSITKGVTKRAAIISMYNYNKALV